MYLSMSEQTAYTHIARLLGMPDSFGEVIYEARRHMPACRCDWCRQLWAVLVLDKTFLTTQGYVPFTEEELLIEATRLGLMNSQGTVYTSGESNLGPGVSDFTTVSAEPDVEIGDALESDKTDYIPGYGFRSE